MEEIFKMYPTVVIKRPVKGLGRRALAAFVTQASRAAGLKGSVTVLVTHSRAMRALNSRFRGKNQATDVLSFPPPASGNGFAGDIALSLEIAARSARSLEHSLGEEVRILILHGILHLAGYDHEDDDGKMGEKELRLRRRFGLPTGLIQRAEKNRVVPKSTPVRSARR